MKKSKPTTDTAQPAEAAPGADFARISIDRIQASPTNPRKTFPQESLESLADNIKRIDVLQPILVRPWPESYPHPEPRPDYELVAGERRWRAAKMAGKSDIPATIRQLTDAETLEIQVVENLQRENPHELEEAEGYDLLMCRHGYSVDMLAEDDKTADIFQGGAQ